MTDAYEDRSTPDLSPAETGCVSNIRLVLSAIVMLGVGMGGFVVGLIWVAVDQPDLPSLIILTVCSMLAGCMLGAILVALRGRVVRIEWNDGGVTFRVGWYRVRSVRWSWSDPIQAKLFLGTKSRELQGAISTVLSGDIFRVRAFLLVLRSGCQEIRIDSLQARWGGIRPFVEVLRRRLPVEEAPFTPDQIDQGPSLRQDMFASQD